MIASAIVRAIAMSLLRRALGYAGVAGVVGLDNELYQGLAGVVAAGTVVWSIVAKIIEMRSRKPT